MLIKSPTNPDEWAGYFHLRWLILRAPWQQPKGSEKDDAEFHDTTFHAMALNDKGETVGVARLHFLSKTHAQIRYMAVAESVQGIGVGSLLLKYLEGIAISNNIERIILQARDNAVIFYQKHQYANVEKSFMMYGHIQHFLMEKVLLK